jgi:hypothetical protein
MQRRAGLVLVVMLASGGPALGDDAATARKAAEGLYRAGDRAFKAGNLLDAADAFEQSYAALPLPDIAFAAAQAHRLQYAVDKQAPRAARALTLYRAYIAAKGSGGRVAEAAEHVLALEVVVGRAPAGVAAGAAPMMRAARTVLLLSSSIAGAVGGVGDDLAPLPRSLEVEPGEHQVTSEAPGYERQTRKVLAVEDRMVDVDFMLAPLPATVALRVEAGTRVIVDGREVGTAPLVAGLALPAGAPPGVADAARPARRGVRARTDPRRDPAARGRDARHHPAPHGAVGAGAPAAWSRSAASGSRSARWRRRATRRPSRRAGTRGSSPTMIASRTTRRSIAATSAGSWR